MKPLLIGIWHSIKFESSISNSHYLAIKHVHVYVRVVSSLIRSPKWLKTESKSTLYPIQSQNELDDAKLHRINRFSEL